MTRTPSTRLKATLIASLILASIGGVTTFALAGGGSLPSPLSVGTSATADTTQGTSDTTTDDTVTDDTTGSTTSVTTMTTPSTTGSTTATTTATSGTVPGDGTSVPGAGEDWTIGTPTPGPRTFTTEGGVVTVVYGDGGVQLASAMANAGWTVEVRREDADRVEVRFRQGEAHVTVEVRVEDGRFREEIQVENATGTTTGNTTAGTAPSVTAPSGSTPDVTSDDGNDDHGGQGGDDDGDDDRSGSGGGDDHGGDDDSGRGGDDDSGRGGDDD